MDIDYTRKSSTNIYYDSRISIHNLSLHQALLESVFHGETTNGDRVEKLKNYHIFSVRTNNKGRILFTFQKIQGQDSLLVLEILENHEYHKAKFLKKHVLQKYLEKNQTKLNADVQDADFEPSDILNTPIQDKNKVIFKSVLDNAHGHIVLGSEQEAVFLGQTPMIIEGPPGSGKTSLAEGLIRQALDKNQSVLMVTRSTRLAKKINQDLSQSPEFDPKQVKVVAYSELFTGLTDNAKSIFDDWYLNFNKYGFLAEELYEEFRILSGSDLNLYTSTEGLGQKQTRFQKPDDRKKIAVLYKIWLSHLTSKNIKLGDFYSPTENEIQQYDLVVLDEAQDFSHLQLKNLTAFAKNNNMVICIDRRQNIEDENPKMIYLKNMMTKKFGVIPNIIQFSTHYRCPQKIMDFAKIFNDLRLELNPKLKAEPQIVDSPHQDGTLVWIEPNNKADMALLQGMKNNPDVCVITHDKFKQEALETLGIIQVFTPEEIKGFEYKTVILYKILETEKIYQANTLLNPNNKNKAKENANCSAELSACFVAATRPTEALYVVQDSKKHDIQFIAPRLKNKIALNTPAPIKVEEISTEFSLEGWEARAKEAVERNDIQTAQSILRQKVNITDPKIIHSKIQTWQKEFPGMAHAENSIPQKVEQKILEPKKVNSTAEKPNKLAVSSSLNATEIAYFKNSIVLNNLKKIKKSLKDQRYVELINSTNCDSGLLRIIYTTNNSSAKLVQKLIKVNNNLNEQDDIQGNNLLMFSAYQKDIDSLNLLIERKVDLNLQNNEGNTALNISTHLRHKEAVNLLIQAGANLNIQCRKGFTPLLTAAYYGYTEIVKQFLQANVLLNLQNIEGSTALMYAACFGHIEIVHLLIQAKADINLKNLLGESALMLAVAKRHAVITKKLIEAKADVNFQNRKGLTPLMMASGLEYDELLDIILAANPDLNLQNATEYSALMIATEEGHFDIVNRLIDAGVDLNLQNNIGYSALMIATENGYFDIVNKLIDAGADLNLQNNTGYSALMIAAENRHFNILNRLIDAGADLNLQNHYLYSALMIATNEGDINIAEKLMQANADLNLQNRPQYNALIIASYKGHIEIVKKLIQAHANLNLQDNNGDTALIWAIRSGHIKIVVLLLEAKIDLNLQNNQRATALAIAIAKGDIDIVEILIQAGAQINQQDMKKNTPLIIATHQGEVGIIKKLLQAGANVNLQDLGGNTALIWAIANEHIKVVELLIQANANPNITDNQGYTPFMIALRSGNWELINMLASGMNSFCSIGNNNEERDFSFINQSTFESMPNNDMYQDEVQIENIYSALEYFEINKPQAMLTQYQSIHSGQQLQTKVITPTSEKRNSNRFKNS